MGPTVNARPFSNWLLSQLFPTAYLVFFPKPSLSSFLEFHFIQDPYSYAVPWGSTLETFPIVVSPQPLRMVMEKGFNQAHHRPRAVPLPTPTALFDRSPQFRGQPRQFRQQPVSLVGGTTLRGGQAQKPNPGPPASAFNQRCPFRPRAARSATFSRSSPAVRARRAWLGRGSVRPSPSVPVPVESLGDKKNKIKKSRF